MAFQMSAAVAASLYQRSNLGLSEALNVVAKRSTGSDGNGNDAPQHDNGNAVLLVLILLNVIFWVPVLTFLGYTLNTILPALAVIEDDDAPPSYQAVSLKEDIADAKLGVPPSSLAAGEPGRPRHINGPVTGGVWATCRHLYAVGGWPYFYRGLGYAMVLNLARFLVGLVVYCSVPAMPPAVTLVVADLATVQLSTLWLHQVISTSGGSKSFWQRLPGFKAAFRATALPMVVSDLAVLLCGAVGTIMYTAMGVPTTKFFETPSPNTSGSIATVLAVSAVQILILLFVVIPASVALFRCQGSLLPADEQTIVPFDRTFQLDTVREKGYVSMVEAWKTFSWAAWKRMVLLCVKVTLITIATESAMAGLIFVQALLVTGMQQKQGI
ncbi:hypothetical protein SLS62_005512 [Diatrype stigma]|uniref:Uncharacterized protein n=1 Tax=Diatrype stigma TaxID=117547 RepID=A0AAN9UP36_9PEZI